MVVINVRYDLIFMFILSGTLINGNSHSPSHPALFFQLFVCGTKLELFKHFFNLYLIWQTIKSERELAGSEDYVRTHITEPPCLVF